MLTIRDCDLIRHINNRSIAEAIAPNIQDQFIYRFQSNLPTRLQIRLKQENR